MTRFIVTNSRRLVVAIAAIATIVWNPCGLHAEPVILRTPAPEIDTPRNTHVEWEALDGKTIGEITVEVRDIFDEPEPSEPYRSVNKIKPSTKQQVVARELLFVSGEPFDHFRVRESERVLRAQRYLRRVDIIPTLRGDVVDIKVTVQDTWTLIPEASYSSGTGRKKRTMGLSESNFGGLGKRVEVGYEEDQNRTTLQGVFEDPRVFGSDVRMLGAYFDRSDGQRSVIAVGQPFRSLLDQSAWTVSSDVADSIGRLYYAGRERYLFRQKSTQLSSRYTISTGDPQHDIVRYSIGVDYLDDQFSRATLEDYETLGLDPKLVDNERRHLASDRTYVGPVLTLEQIEPNFISMNYIDRFDRVQDYNLGDQSSLSFFFAPDALGSTGDSLQFTLTKSNGYQFDAESFIRGEIGLSSRYRSDGLTNTLGRAELKYYRVLGTKHIYGLFIGKHTLAANIALDYGHDLDKDREFLVGGDNAIRGYRARTFFGDKRFIANAEDRVHLADDVLHLVSVGAAAFVDVGGATRGTVSELMNDRLYPDVGVGLRFAFPRSAGGSVLRVDLAVPLRDGPDGSNSLEFRVIFAGGQLFQSSLRSESVGPEKANVSLGVER